MLAADAVHLVDRLDHVHRNTDRARLVGDRAGDGLANPPGGVGRELVATAVFELVHRLHQADVAFLDQIEELQATVGVLLGNRDHEAQVGLDHFLLGIARGGFTFVHALVDAFELGQRHHDARLQVHQLLLQVLDGRNVAAHHGRPRLASGGLLLDPLQVQQVGREFLDERLLGHAALVHDDAAQLALLLAHIVHLAAHHVAQLFDGLGGEADGHQLFRQGGLGLHVGRGAVAFLVIDLVDLLEQLAQLVKALQRLLLEFFELLGQRLGAALAVVIVGFVEFVEVFFGHIVIGLVGVGEAVHDGRDDDLAFADLFAHVQDFGDGGGRCADRLHHGHQAAFDALGDFDFAFAGQQFHGAHFAHVHAHGVGGAAEFRVHGRERGFRSFFGFFFGGAGGGVVRDDQRFGVRGLLVHRHAQIVQGGDNGFERFGIDQLVGQVVVDFYVREVTAGLAQLDQRLQARAALLQVFFGQDGFVQAEFLHQGAFLGLADLHAQWLDLFDRGCCLGGLFDFAFQIGFDVRQVGVVAHVIAGSCGLGLAATLGGGLGFATSGGCLGRAAGLLLGGFFVVSGRGGCLGARRLLLQQFISSFDQLGSTFHRHVFHFLGVRSLGSNCGLFGRGFGRCFGSGFGDSLGGGVWSSLGRLRGLLSGHEKPQIQKLTQRKR